MKVSFCSIAFRHHSFSIEEIIPKIAKLGYDGLEIWGNHLEGFSQAKALKKILNKYGLMVPMISPYFDFTSTPEKWEKSLETARQFIDLAQVLEAPLIRAFTGVVGSQEATPKQKKACVEGLKRITAMAEEKGVTLALETHPSTLVDTLESTLELLTEVNTPNLRINLDIYHLWEVYQDSLKVLDVLYPYVAHIHAKNANLPKELRKRNHHPFLHDRQAAQEFPGIAPLQGGEMDYSSFLRELAKKRFSGFISVEWFGDNILKVAEQELGFIRRELNH